MDSAKKYSLTSMALGGFLLFGSSKFSEDYRSYLAEINSKYPTKQAELLRGMAADLKESESYLQFLEQKDQLMGSNLRSEGSQPYYNSPIMKSRQALNKARTKFVEGRFEEKYGIKEIDKGIMQIEHGIAEDQEKDRKPAYHAYQNKVKNIREKVEKKASSLESLVPEEATKKVYSLKTKALLSFAAGSAMTLLGFMPFMSPYPKREDSSPTEASYSSKGFP